MKLISFFLGITATCFLSVQAVDWLAYIPTGGRSSGDINIFDVQANNFTPDSPILVFSTDPFALAITPDRKTVYIIQGVLGTIEPIDTATNTPGTQIPLPVGSVPEKIAITPDGTTAFITSSTTPPELLRLNLATQAIDSLTIGTVSSSAFGLAITPDGSKVYIANPSEDNVFIVDIPTFTVDPQSPVSVGTRPTEIAVKPNGTEVLVINEGSKTISIIDTATNQVTGTITLPTLIAIPANIPTAIAITPDGTIAYVSNEFSNTVTPINLSTNQPGTPIPLVAGTDVSPNSIAFTPDGQTAFVANFVSATLSRIDGVKAPTQTVSSFPLSGVFGFAVAITPDQAPTANFSFTKPSLNQPVTFNASASTSPTGSISQYSWNFGDGSAPVTVTSPTIKHTYKTTGTFIVTLTVTNSAGTSTTQTFTGQTMSNNGGPTAQLAKTIRIEKSIELSPPTHLRGRQIKEEFATQTDIINIIKWSPPTQGETPSSYRIYRDEALTQLLADIPATAPLKFADHNRHPHIVYTYFVVSVDAKGNVSAPATIAIP